MKSLIVLCAVVAVSLAKPGYLTGGIASLNPLALVSPAVVASNLPVAPEPVQETPEVAAARAAHLKAFEEAAALAAASPDEEEQASDAAAAAPKAAEEPAPEAPAAPQAEETPASTTRLAEAPVAPAIISPAGYLSHGVIPSGIFSTNGLIAASPGYLGHPGLFTTHGYLGAPAFRFTAGSAAANPIFITAQGVPQTQSDILAHLQAKAALLG